VIKKTGLILTGGGARAAYQAGVLKGISDITDFKECPFKIISGVSAGAINGVWLGAHSSDFKGATQMIWDTWSTIEMQEVFKTNPASFFKIFRKWLTDLIFGGRFQKPQFTSLLNSDPLAGFIKSKLNFQMIKESIQTGRIHGLAVTTTNYYSGASITFFDGDGSIQPWTKKWREARRTDLNLGHILASSSIPIFFPPVELEDGFYGDGGIKLSAPLSPAIHMGADKILAIGIRHLPEPNDIPPHLTNKPISMGDITGTLLNAMFFHSIDTDIERFERINRTIAILGKEELAKDPDHLKIIPLLAINPSEDLGRIDSDLFSRFPKMLRYLLQGVGASDLESRDMMSYLAFESTYLTTLLSVGYQDAMKREKDILDFFRE
jgi:NTE family protein